MIKIIGVRFRRAGKIYYFDPEDLDIKTGMHVIVETARGVEYGSVAIAPRETSDKSVVQPLKKVIRIATPEDDDINEENRAREREAYKICLEKIAKYGLKMKLIDVEYTFDNNKILFYFTADGRIDFRELVKDLASVFKTRIELRQIGVRDETKMLGGIGICGRDLCCYSYMPDFVPVSIKMAKEQTLSLNPAKISGVCGRLMCCLKYEQDTYEWLNSKLPNIGDYVVTADGFEGVVGNVNVMRQRVKVFIKLDNDTKEAREYGVDELKFTKGVRAPLKNDGTDAGSSSEAGRAEQKSDTDDDNRSRQSFRRSRKGRPRQGADGRKPHSDAVYNNDNEKQEHAFADEDHMSGSSEYRQESSNRRYAAGESRQRSERRPRRNKKRNDRNTTGREN